MRRSFLAAVAAAVTAVLALAGASPAAAVIDDKKNDLGCAAQCITSQTTTTVGPFAATIDVVTDVETVVALEYSELAPHPSVGGSPPQFDVNATLGAPYWSLHHTFGLADLDAGTTYYVVASAIDRQGRTAWRQGHLTTKGRHAVITFDRVKIIDDADDGPNRGEVQFNVTYEGGVYAGFPWRKVSTGDYVGLHSGIALHDVDQKVWISTMGWECDAFNWTCSIDADFPLGGGGSGGPDLEYASEGLHLDLDTATAPSDAFGSDYEQGHHGYFTIETTRYHLKYRLYGWWDVSYW